jgi:hypothetical protein
MIALWSNAYDGDGPLCYLLRMRPVPIFSRVTWVTHRISQAWAPVSNRTSEECALYFSPTTETKYPSRVASSCRWMANSSQRTSGVAGMQ